MITLGTRLGPYEVVARVGAGGMGEVFRARDARLQRDVAVKVLPAAVQGDPDRLRRFELEARAAGGLNHPNILAIHDVGTHEGSPYVVSELLEGATLREALQGGALPLRKALDQARQVADGLAAAHDRGIVHRDLKPENLFVTRDGRVKILDFGLAKVVAPANAASDDGDTASVLGAGTEPGVVMGTVGYMAPEQVQGREADARADIFAFGAVLHEMLSGQRAFSGPSAVDVLHAILRSDPPPLTGVPPAVARVVERCLEKDPTRRFRSAHDLAFALEASSLASGAPAVARTAVTPGAQDPKSRWRLVAALAGALGLGSAAGAVLAPRADTATAPTFERVTFRRGSISHARRTTDGAVVYSASWNGEPQRVFVSRPGQTDALALALDDARVVGVYGHEIAVMLGFRWPQGGTLARLPITGGTPRELVRAALGAHWSADGHLAVARRTETGTRLEYPLGTAVYEGPEDLDELRVSPDGRHIAFSMHPVPGDDRGYVAVLAPGGQPRRLTPEFHSLRGVAWSPSGSEILFTHEDDVGQSSLRAVDLEGRDRVLHRHPGRLVLHDVAGDGSMVMAREALGLETILDGLDAPPRDLTWLDATRATGLTPDGGHLVFTETGAGGGESYSVFMRRTDGAPAVRLGSGTVGRLSQDGTHVLVPELSRPRLAVYPLEAGEPRVVELPRFEPVSSVAWMPDGERIVFVAREKGAARPRLWMRSLGAEDTRPVTPEDGPLFDVRFVTPDGRFAATLMPDGADARFVELATGQSRPIPGLPSACQPIAMGDAKHVFCFVSQRPPAPLYHVDVAAGTAVPWTTLAPPDPAGVSSIYDVNVTGDGRRWVFSYARALSELHVVKGLR